MSEKKRQKKQGQDTNKKNQRRRAKQGAQSRDELTQAPKRRVARGRA
jgi:hypothetical protein